METTNLTDERKPINEEVFIQILKNIKTRIQHNPKVDIAQEFTPLSTGNPSVDKNLISLFKYQMKSFGILEWDNSGGVEKFKINSNEEDFKASASLFMDFLFGDDDSLLNGKDERIQNSAKEYLLEIRKNFRRGFTQNIITPANRVNNNYPVSNALSIKEKILEYYKRVKRAYLIQLIAEYPTLDEHTLRSEASILAKTGKITRVSRGLYETLDNSSSRIIKISTPETPISELNKKVAEQIPVINKTILKIVSDLEIEEKKLTQRLLEIKETKEKLLRS